MTDNTLTIRGPAGQIQEIYTSQLLQVFDEYLVQMDIQDKEEVTPSIFTGALKHIYMQIFQPHEKQPYNRNTVLDTGDIEAIEKVWTIYTGLCYKYGIAPTMLRFGILTGISPDTFSTWRNSEYRANQSHSAWYEKALKECESAVVDKIVEKNSVGAIFISKARFGYRETSPLPAEAGETLVHDSAEQIMARHKNAQLPEPLDI